MIEPYTLVEESAAEARVTTTRARRRMVVRGIVQGVGFRPHVWRLARDHELAGFVRNTSGGVVIEAEGDIEALAAFTGEVVDRAPSLARVDGFTTVEVPASGEEGFRIEPSRAVAGEHQPISPDAATCDECLTELWDPGDRRHLHPFINCTNCGPRFTIIEDIPYDRPLTTMRAFAMCDPCRAEYENPADRRFHAQPIACPDCGPQLRFTDCDGRAQAGEPVNLAATALRDGRIVAVKGLGGFQLACDATSAPAVELLRERKHRPSKPFALMVRDLEAAQRLCEISPAEATLLTSAARPVVLLRRRGHTQPVASAVAPGSDELGIMLPYTPLHHLLLSGVSTPLVMTSGNLSEEPIAKDNAEAVDRLGPLADGFLLHDRDIYARYDDSVVRVVGGDEQVIRRARGYCPLAIPLEGVSGTVLAFGAHLKNTFCVVTGGQAYVGPHIGDLNHPLSLTHEQEALATYLRLFRADPDLIACDLHPDYASTRLAEGWADLRRPPVRVQHHHAHIASVMAEHALHGPLIGVAFDGTGYGPDGTVWGGEFLVCDQASYRRAGHLTPVRQPGGDLCAREGWRMAASYLLAAGLAPGTPPDHDERAWRLVCRLATSDMAPLSSSAGRLFDAVASLLGVAHTSSFEAEAAMQLETLARGIDADSIDALPVEVLEGGMLQLATPALVRQMVEQRDAGRSAEELAAVFHESIAQAIVDICCRLAAAERLTRVALSGGVFQNRRLLERSTALLGARGLDVYTNHLVPANDGGISLGQALVAASSVQP